MHKTFKFRLRPSHAQTTLMLRILEECRWVYNETLTTRKQAWEERKESLSLYDTQALLPEWKKSRPSLKHAYSQSLQNVQVRVDLAFNAFFRRVRAGEKPGYPRFRAYDRYDSFTYPQYLVGCKVEDDRVHLGKIGSVRFIGHRPIVGAIKTVTVRRDAAGKWWIAFSVETEPEPLPASEEVVGIDVGLEAFATLSTGERESNPRFFRRDERDLARAQRRLSRCEKDTPERKRARQIVTHVHERIRQRRHDFIHQVSRRFVNRFGMIAVEDLEIQHMLNLRPLAKSISDAAWGEFLFALAYKAEWAGRQFARVDPRHTSQCCSRCGNVMKKELSERLHQCSVCGLQMHRDHNAALNILARGLASLGLDP